MYPVSSTVWYCDNDTHTKYTVLSYQLSQRVREHVPIVILHPLQYMCSPKTETFFTKEKQLLLRNGNIPVCVCVCVCVCVFVFVGGGGR